MINKIFKAREFAPFKEEDAQEIGEFFDLNEGKTTGEILEEVKKNKEHVIYSYIEWDDKKAGENFRLQQIREIKNHITILVTEIERGPPIKAFYSVKETPTSTEKICVGINAIFSNEYYRKQIIERAMSELKNWAERYGQYKELSEIIGLIEPFISEKQIEIQ